MVTDPRSPIPERIRVRLSPEVMVDFPVEVVVNGTPGFVGPGMLGISSGLEHDLVIWLRWWQDRVGFGDTDDDADEEGDDETWRSWNKAGQQLVDRLGHELGDSYHVEWE